MSVCLLISSFNRGALLEQTLNRLSQLTKPDEVLVVDDGGTDATREIVTRVVIDCPVRYLYTHNPGESICSHARNVGINYTDCDLVITTEPEMWFKTDVIAQMLALHDERPNEAISVGTVYHQQGPSSSEDSDHVTRGWVAPWICLYRRDWLLDIGGWDETFVDPWGWEDTDLLTRLRVSGHGQHIAQEIEARHLWHAHRGMNINQERNEAHFRAKIIDADDMRDLVANEGREWGTVKT